MDVCVPRLEESSPLFERSKNGFHSLINAWNKKSAIFVEHQRFCVSSNFMTKDIKAVIMKLQLLHGDNKMLIGGQKERKQIMTPIIQKKLQPLDVE
jgi:hypothetical protein